MKRILDNQTSMSGLQYIEQICLVCKGTYKVYIDSQTKEQVYLNDGMLYRSDCDCSYECFVEETSIKVTAKIKEQANKKNWLDCGINEKQIQHLKESSFKWPRDFSSSIQQINRFIENFYVTESKGYIFMGTAGCGKSTLAKKIAIKLLDKGHKVFYTGFSNLLKHQKDRFSDSELEDKTPHTQNADLLILDDIGAEKSSEWSDEVLYNILEYRYENKLPIIVIERQTI